MADLAIFSDFSIQKNEGAVEGKVIAGAAHAIPFASGCLGYRSHTDPTQDASNLISTDLSQGITREDPGLAWPCQGLAAFAVHVSNYV